MVGIAFLLLLSVEFVSGLSCTPNWLEYEGRCYAFQKNNKTWKDAMEICVYLDSLLVEVDTISKQMWLRDQMTNHSIKTMWIGATSVYTKGELVWIPSGRPLMPFESWHHSEPEYRISTDTQKCAQLHSFYLYSWKSADCNRKNAYICMKPLVGPRCEEGYDIFKGKCYLFQFIYHVTWQSAVESCYSRGADLVEIDNAKLNKWLGDKYIRHYWIRAVWIGATTQFRDGKWFWLTGDRPAKPLIRWSWLELKRKQRYKGAVLMNKEYFGDWEINPIRNSHQFVCEGID